MAMERDRPLEVEQSRHCRMKRTLSGSKKTIKAASEKEENNRNREKKVVKKKRKRKQRTDVKEEGEEKNSQYIKGG